MLNIEDIMEETETKVSLANYSLRIMGMSGFGKTPIYAMFAKKFQEEYKSDKPVCALLPFEPRYKHIAGLSVIKPPLKREDGSICKNADGKIIMKDTISNWEELTEIVDSLVDAKINNPNFRIRRICFDTITKIELLGQAEVIRLDFEKTKEVKSFNKIGSRGSGYLQNVEIVRAMKQRLTDVGYIIDQLVQVREKTLMDDITGEEYKVCSADCSESLDGKAFLQDADISVALAIPKVLVKTGVKSGGMDKGAVIKTTAFGGKVLVLNSSGAYTGIKSPFENAPATIPATNFEETVDAYFKLFKERMSLKIDKPYEEKANEEIKEKIEVEHQLEDIEKGKIKSKKEDKIIDEFLVYYSSLVKNMQPTDIKAWQDYFNSLMAQNKTKDIKTALKAIPKEQLEQLYKQFGYTPKSK